MGSQGRGNNYNNSEIRSKPHVNDVSSFKTRTDGKWVEVILSFEPGWEDPISAVVFNSGFSGLEEKTEGNKPLVKAYGSNEPSGEDIVTNLREAIENLPSDSNIKILSVNSVPFEDWEYSWRKGLDAIEIGSGIVVRPSWVKYENKQNLLEILIDPKMAFGTGSHASTHLCLELIEKMNLRSMKVMDAGCGSGVLGITAAKLGASEVYCFDNDPFSVDNAIENAEINGVGGIVCVEERNLEDVAGNGFELIFANIISHVLLPNLPKFYEFLKSDGIIIFSGLLSAEEKNFTKELKNTGFIITEVLYREEWMAVKAAKPL